MTQETTITKDDGVGEEIQASCVKCGDGKAHAIRSAIKEYNVEEHYYGSSEWINKYQVIQCGGCKSYSFRKTQSNSEDPNPMSDDDPEVVEVFPSRVNGRAALNGHELLPAALQQIYLETLQALNTAQPVLAGIGIRAIVETVCKEQKATGRKLEIKIDDLVAKQVLTREGANILHKLRVLGNKSAHDVEPHDVQQLRFAFDVIDNLLSSVYILPHRANATFQ